MRKNLILTDSNLSLSIQKISNNIFASNKIIELLMINFVISNFRNELNIFFKKFTFHY